MIFTKIVLPFKADFSFTTEDPQWPLQILPFLLLGYTEKDATYSFYRVKLKHNLADMKTYFNFLIVETNL